MTDETMSEKDHDKGAGATVDRSLDTQGQTLEAEVSTIEIQREKNRARALRRSEWWKRKRATGICHHCQRRFLPVDLTMDHLVPLARGGKSTKGNLVPACKDCNSKKKYALPWEWKT